MQTIITATIASGTALSPQTNIGQGLLVGIQMPAGWDTAALTFQVSSDGGQTFGEFQDGAGTAITFSSPSAGIYIGVDPTKWRGVNCVKVRSGTSGTPVNQTATRAIGLVTEG